MALTTAAAADGSFALSYENPRLVGAVLTAEALVGLLAAFLVLGRVRRTHRAADLLLCCGLALLAAAQLGLSAIPELVSEEGSRFAAWTGLLARAGGAALLLAAAFVRAGVQARVRARLALTATFGIAWAAAIVVALLAPQLPDASGFDFAARGEAVVLHGPPAAVALRLAGAALFLGAAIGFARRAERERDVFLVGIAVACVYAFFARVNFVIHPAHELGRFATGDLFVALFHLVVLSAAVAEIFRVWHAEAAAAALDERRRIARDLHDGLAQELASVMRNLHRAGDDSRHLALARASAERALGAARHAIAALDDPGRRPLAAILREISVATAEREATRVDLDLDASADAPPAARQALALITSEAITNAARHGHAHVVQVRLLGGPRIRLAIEDDGRGFAPEGGVNGGYGIRGMRERAALIGATLDVTSSPGEGTSVEVEL
jgi:signal transduction histidine kinase